MDATSLQQFRIVLQEKKTQLLAQLGRAEREARAGADRPTDTGDQSAATLGRESLFAQADASRRMLRAVEEALVRIREGTFGECERCGDEIAPVRLKALPWARRCVACQEKLERRHHATA